MSRRILRKDRTNLVEKLFSIELTSRATQILAIAFLLGLVGFAGAIEHNNQVNSPELECSQSHC